MKLIHTADLHLDSSLSRHYTREGAERRRQELLSGFLRILDFAEREDAAALLIAGDLFDSPAVSGETLRTVLDAFRAHAGLSVFYLRGNHDTENVFRTFSEALPENLHFFTTDWTSYRIAAHVTLSGREFLYGRQTPAARGDAFTKGLSLLEEDFNLLLLHGTLSMHGEGQENGEGLIPLSALRHRAIDYLALGHIHGIQGGELDARGCWQYAGCPEARGFDECGEHGVFLLEIDEAMHHCTRRRVDLGLRHFHEIPVEVDGAESNAALLERMRCLLPGEEDAARFLLRGKRAPSLRIHTEFLRQQLAASLHLTEVVDETRLEVDYEGLRREPGLKGEYVRLLEESSELTEEMRTELLQLGLRILMGEEL